MHIEPAHLEEARRILAFWVPGIPVFAYGSRVHGRGLKRTSDLDLCLKGNERVAPKTIQRVKDAFMLSEIPFRVDVVDWHDLSEDFRRIIGRDMEPLSGCG
jgi:uncharacterized protein